MNTLHPSPDHAVRITRVDDDEWHAFDDGQVVGRGFAGRRPDGRLFVGVDAWHGPVFDRLAAALLADLPGPLYAVADEAEDDLTEGWRRAGFTVHRRESDYLIPTDPRLTGMGSVRPPSDVTILPAGHAAEAPLNALDRAIRAEAAADAEGPSMPAEVLHRPDDGSVLFPERHAVAVRSGRYVGLVRVSPPARRARIGLIAVLADERRRGIARALLAHELGALHDAGVESAVTEVDEANAAAVGLFEGVGARRAGRIVEFVRP